jgi:hypothetical protein
MRRIAIAFFGVVSLLTVAAGGAAAAGPQRFAFEPFVQTFVAGQVCEFRVRWDSDVLHANTLVFPVNRAGDQVIRSVGEIRTRITNVDTGKSVTVGGGIRQDLVFHSDGTVNAIIDGTVVAGYFPTDLGGPAMWLFRGHLNDTLDSSFTLLRHQSSGTQQDLCAALR